MVTISGSPPSSRVVVTGAAGFIGSHLVDALLVHGYEVVAVDRRGSESIVAVANLGGAMGYERLRMHCGDLAEMDISSMLTGADVVFHLAAVPGVRDSWGARFDEYVRTNISATQRIVLACEQAGVRRLVLASSSSVYGEASSPSAEFDHAAPCSPYGVSKLAGEQLALAHARRRDTRLSVVALRYFTVFGPRQRAGMGINQALVSALFDVAVPLFGDGTQRREFTYIDDVVAGTLAAAWIHAQAEVINIGGGASTSMREVLDTAESVTGRSTTVYPMPEQAGDVTTTCADLQRARQLLGYQPAVGLEEGMRRQARWLQDLPPDVRISLLPSESRRFDDYRRCRFGK
ncbi:NAD-dependent epimerase/dehydratase family protein [Nocardia alni]|uniref:NAD-dependent epimerase/dehydratase family protein n=1 Tax=Nocardia alni TaxID=2815723 RepID=UPI0020B30641|nr:NAD-dependent epimerase/dehydratase family protein [Nocardia alni]